MPHLVSYIGTSGTLAPGEGAACAIDITLQGSGGVNVLLCFLCEHHTDITQVIFETVIVC